MAVRARACRGGPTQGSATPAPAGQRPQMPGTGATGLEQHCPPLGKRGKGEARQGGKGKGKEEKEGKGRRGKERRHDPDTKRKKRLPAVINTSHEDKPAQRRKRLDPH